MISESGAASDATSRNSWLKIEVGSPDPRLARQSRSRALPTTEFHPPDSNQAQVLSGGPAENDLLLAAPPLIQRGRSAKKERSYRSLHPRTSKNAEGKFLGE
jgi:hypothetical protein